MTNPPASPLVHKLKMRRKRRLQMQRDARRGALWNMVTHDERFQRPDATDPAITRHSHHFFGRIATRFMRRGSRAPQ